MSRTSIAVAAGAPNSSVAETLTVMAGGATGTDGYQVAAIAADERLVITLSKDSGATGLVWLKAGTYDASGQGDLEVILAAGDTKVIGPLEGARFKTVVSGVNKIYIDAGTTGSCGVVALK